MDNTFGAPLVSRRTVLLGVPAVALLSSGILRTDTASASVVEPANHGRADDSTALTVRGADMSFTLQEYAAGKHFRDRGRVSPVENILVVHGANYARLRLWVNPPAGYSDLGSVLEAARRAKRAGMKLLLDLHYSDFWADPGHQSTPAAWAGQDLATLAATVRAYTRDTIATLARHGTPVDMVQIGNEVTSGMLWPVGQIYLTSVPNFPTSRLWSTRASRAHAKAIRGTSS